MVQTMEAWIVADSAALSSYYGQGFRANKLPKAPDLETEAKTTVERSLVEATKDTQKGRYHKIKHASDLLKRIDVESVKAGVITANGCLTISGSDVALNPSKKSAS